MELTDARALVTGSSSGIGEAIAVELAQGGADVAVHYAGNEEGAEATAKRVGKHGGRAPVLQADFTDPEAAEALAREARDALGGVDVLVNNAGIIDEQGDGPKGGKPFADRIPEWEPLTNVNLRAPFVLTALLAPDMVDRGEGVVVNTSSVAGRIARREVPLYSLTKAGLIHLTRQCALEYAPEVRVNAVAPGWVPTEFGWGQLTDDDFQEAMRKQIPQDRWGEAGEIADAVRFLVESGSYTTGAVLPAAGGLEAITG